MQEVILSAIFLTKQFIWDEGLGLCSWAKG